MKMLVCTDGSEQSLKAVREAARIAENLKEVEVTVLTIHETWHTPMHGLYGESIPEEVQTRYEGLRAKGREEILEAAVKIFKEKGIEPTTLIRKGHPSDAIIQLATEQESDFIVLGSRGLGGVKRIILGSVSNAVAQQAKSNVLIIK